MDHRPTTNEERVDHSSELLQVDGVLSCEKEFLLRLYLYPTRKPMEGCMLVATQATAVYHGLP
jgi:hypothetical protein